MDQASYVSEESERQAFILEDNPFNGQSTEQSELKFPWSLIETIANSKKTFQQSKSKFVKQLLHSFHFQLLVVFIICIIDMIVGSAYLGHCNYHRMLCCVFIVQGACGLFVVLIHTCTIIFDLTPSKIAHLPIEYRVSVGQIITFTRLVTVFSIVWFFIGHIWFLQVFGGNSYWPWYDCGGMRPFTIIMVIMQYIVGIWMTIFRIWYRPRVLSWLRKKVQDRLTELPDNDTCLRTEEPIVDQKPVDNNQCLMII